MVVSILNVKRIIVLTATSNSKDYSARLPDSPFLIALLKCWCVDLGSKDLPSLSTCEYFRLSSPCYTLYISICGHELIN